MEWHIYQNKLIKIIGGYYNNEIVDIPFYIFQISKNLFYIPNNDKVLYRRRIIRKFTGRYVRLKVINSAQITEEVKRLCIEGNLFLGRDVVDSFRENLQKEESD